MQADLIINGSEFEQELRPLVKSFYQNHIFNVEVNDFEPDLVWPCIQNERLVYPDGKGGTYEPFNVEKGMVLHLSKERFHAAVFDNHTLCGYAEELYEDNAEKLRRNQLARCIYKLLSNATRQKLPWGILTGVRPTKLVLDCIEQGVGEDRIRELMSGEYLCSDEKLSLSLKVAGRENEILGTMNYKNGYSLYIGIPFCPTTCSYCSFTSFPLTKFGELTEPYIEALLKEMEYASHLFPERELNSVYFGGGTPTALSAQQLERLLTAVRKLFNMDYCKELTVEAGRPDSITREKLEVLRKMNVDRISINPQTMNNKTLELIGRKHTAEQIDEAYAMAREIGFDNINTDLIIGLNGETPEDVAYTLERIDRLRPDSLTVHTLAIKRAARMNIEKKQFADIGTSQVERMQQLTAEYTALHGYEPYYLYRQKNMAENLENTGYSLPGREGIYNVLIMEEKQTIVALGAGGASKFIFQNPKTEGRLSEDPGCSQRIERVENVKNLKDYIERVDEMIQRKADFVNLYRTELFK